MSDINTYYDVCREIARMDPGLDRHSSDFRTAVLLASSLIVGTGINGLSKFTGYDRRWVSERVKRLRVGGVFKQKSRIASEWLGEDGGIAFWLDVMVAQGHLQRAAARAEKAPQE